MLLSNFAKIAVVSAKIAHIFAKIFGKIFFKNHNIGPWSLCTKVPVVKP
jgi:3-isopropylmalate dehydratase small subunit